MFHHFGALTLPLHWVFSHGLQMRPSFPFPQCLGPICLLSRFLSRAMHSRGIFQVVFPERFLSCTDSRFTSFTENFAICCYQVTKFSARSTQFRSFGKWVQILCLPNTASPQRLWSWVTRRTRGCVPVSWNTFIHKILRKFFSPFWQITQRVCPYGLVVSIITCSLASAGSCDGRPRTVLLVLSLLVVAGRNVGTTASCNTDVGYVGEAELEEPVDEPGATIGTWFSVLHFIRLPSLMSCDFWPMVRW